MTRIIYFEAVYARENIAGAALLCVVFLHLQAEKSGEWAHIYSSTEHIIFVVQSQKAND